LLLLLLPVLLLLSSSHARNTKLLGSFHNNKQDLFDWESC
jgi:hypothetical protein